MRSIGAIQTPSIATLRISDGRQSRAEALRAKGSAFQLITKDVRIAPGVMSGIYSLFL